MELTTQDIVTAISGRLIRPGEKRIWNHISTDSRTVRKDDLFFALEGPSFNGHDYIRQAAMSGAGGAVIKSGFFSPVQIDRLPDNLAVMETTDTLHALGETAAAWREKIKPMVVGITGSCGKTTTKEMVSEITSNTYPTAKTMGNFNNLVGLPVSLLGMTGKVKVAVLEMGMNKFGEISRLCEIACPNVGLITNVTSAHVGMLGSIENVALAKGEILPHISHGGTFIRNLDDEYILKMSKNFKGREITYSFKQPADVRLVTWNEKDDGGYALGMDIQGELLSITLNALGIHNVMNALAAAAVGVALLADKNAIIRGLESFRPFDGRMKLFRLKRNINVIDDSYNANPEAMKQSLATVAELSRKHHGRFIAVLGDMGELGDHARAAHVSLGHKLAELGADKAFYLGTMYPSVAQGAEEAGLPANRLREFEDRESIVLALQDETAENDWILIKASRSMGLEQIAAAFCKNKE